METAKRSTLGAFAKVLSSLSDLPQMAAILAKTGTFEKILFALANMALEQGKLGLEEGFIDATFAPERGKARK